MRNLKDMRYFAANRVQSVAHKSSNHLATPLATFFDLFRLFDLVPGSAIFTVRKCNDSANGY